MANPSAASRAEEITRPSKSLSKAAHRRAAAVSQKLAARGLCTFIWHKKLDRDLSRGLVPDIVSLRSERRRCLARRKEAAAVSSSSAAASRRTSPPPITTAFLARAEEDAKEAAFLLEQSRLRAETRFGHGRPKPIDLLVKSLDGTLRCALSAFRGASLEDLRELGKQIAEPAGLDRANGPFWEAAKVMCDAEIAKAAGTAASPWTAGGSGSLLYPVIVADVRRDVGCKSAEELDEMQATIAARLATGQAMVVEYWQEVLELIRVERARKFLEENYSTRDDAPPAFDGHDEEPESADDDGDGFADADEEESEAICPVAVPRTLTKPKYIARVRSGFEWNKYNRVHYDHDRPPPKTVKGYKFVVFYPGFTGTKAPEYTIHKDGDGESGETCIIRFHAGPPYEDIAFRIVNKEWEYSRKAGFRCTFDRGILHLNFHFKRFFYKR
ncbi:cactin [Brachypodium distachyon]|uniref:Splicing factor Cactin n=1 Tax=Brachypodium distachyon TaxID=15368 RepID=I1J0H1_BRADI|nr:cactin [Brachypodium distachyon]KQJ84002.1 hypothetical protein BRADI_5g18070v3 [Brachypodium distachyon]|eukprot:XP_003581515.1 cactin [Brachypodium distachyon]